MSLRGSPIKRLDLFGQNVASSAENTSLTLEVQRLNAVVHSKNVEIKQLLDQNKMLKITYEEELAAMQKSVKLMERQLKEVEISRSAEFEVIKQKYDKINAEQTENLKSYHIHEMEFLLKEIANLRVQGDSRKQQIILKDKQFVSMKESYERQIQQKMTEINNLNRNMLAIEEYKNKQIKDLTNKRELERSRTSGIVSSRKQNNQFMDKQLRKLNEQVLQKAIKIENMNRQLNKLKRKLEESQRVYTKKIDDLLKERDQQNKERQEHYAKIQKALRDQLLEFRSKQLELMTENDRQKDQIQSLKAEVRRINEVSKSKEQEIRGYKQMLEKQREDHANQISNLMKERKKRSSKMGSSRSLNSSMRMQQANEEMPITNVPLKQTESVRLPIVREESPDRSLNHSLDRSNVTEQNGEDEDNELAKAVYHYDALIDELKRSHASEIELLKHKINKSSKNLEEKQQQILDILTRFSPLVKIHAQEKSIQQDRKERIQRHWKADLALLQVLINKYHIKAYH